MNLDLLLTALFLYLLFSTTWVLYVAIMNLKEARDAGKLTAPAKVIGYPILFIGFVFDIAFNWIIGSIMLLEFPRELLFTSRCRRHYASAEWRGAVARWSCRHFLHPFDEGHCR